MSADPAPFQTVTRTHFFDESVPVELTPSPEAVADALRAEFVAALDPDISAMPDRVALVVRREGVEARWLRPDGQLVFLRAASIGFRARLEPSPPSTMEQVIADSLSVDELSGSRPPVIVGAEIYLVIPPPDGEDEDSTAEPADAIFPGYAIHLDLAPGRGPRSGNGARP